MSVATTARTSQTRKEALDSEQRHLRNRYDTCIEELTEVQLTERAFVVILAASKLAMSYRMWRWNSIVR